MEYFAIFDKNIATIFQLQFKIENISDMFLQYSVLCGKVSEIPWLILQTIDNKNILKIFLKYSTNYSTTLTNSSKNFSSNIVDSWIFFRFLTRFFSFIFLKKYNSKTINEKNLKKNQYTFFSLKNIIKNREACLRGWESPSGRVGMECLIYFSSSSSSLFYIHWERLRECSRGANFLYANCVQPRMLFFYFLFLFFPPSSNPSIISCLLCRHQPQPHFYIIF